MTRAHNACSWGESSVMPSWVTWRRALGALLTIIVVAAIAGGIALRVAKKAAAEAPGGSAGPPVTLEFTPADVARIESRELARWLPVSGTLQPVNQTTVKAKVSGDIRQVFVREGEAVKAGRGAGAPGHRRSRSQADRSHRRARGESRTTRSPKDADAEPYAADAGLHLAECLRQRRATFRSRRAR